MALAPTLLENATRFLPGLKGVTPRGVRACARPSSADGWPFLGPLPGLEGVSVASGHGAWGITLGPASARLVADQLLGRPAEIPPALRQARRAAAAYSADGLSVTSVPVGAVLPVEVVSVVDGVSVVVGRRVGRVVVDDLSLQAEDLAVLAGAVDVVLAAVALDEDERLPVTRVAARVQVEALARAGEDVVERATVDLAGLLARRRSWCPCRVSDGRGRAVGS